MIRIVHNYTNNCNAYFPSYRENLYLQTIFFEIQQVKYYTTKNIKPTQYYCHILN